MLGHALPDLQEKLPVEIAPVTTALGVGQLVKVEEPLPVMILDFGPLQYPQFQSLLRNPAPFTAQGFALAAVETGEKVIETLIAPVEPVKLAGQAGAGSQLCQQGCILLFWK